MNNPGDESAFPEFSWLDLDPKGDRCLLKYPIYKPVGGLTKRELFSAMGARICTGDGKKIWLGTFKKAIDAAKAYDAASIKYHGEYGRLNFPQTKKSFK